LEQGDGEYRGTPVPVGGHHAERGRKKKQTSGIRLT